MYYSFLSLIYNHVQFNKNYNKIHVLLKNLIFKKNTPKFAAKRFRITSVHCNVL